MRVEDAAGNANHLRHRVGVVELDRNEDLPPSIEPMAHDGRDDGAQLRVDRVGDLDLARDRRLRAALEAGGKSSTISPGNAVSMSTSSALCDPAERPT